MATVHLAAGSTGRLLEAARALNILSRSDIRRRKPAATALFLVGLHEAGEIAWIRREVRDGVLLSDPLQMRLAGLAFLNGGEPDEARQLFSALIEAEPENPMGYRLLGRALAVAGDYEVATQNFARSVEIAPRMVMAHHNSAGRYDVANYIPSSWELAHAGEILIYDVLAQQAEETAFIGDLAASLQAGQAMLEQQKRLADRFFVPREILLAVQRNCPKFDPDKPFRLLPYEWITQLGHMGMVEAHRKMNLLGVTSEAQLLLLAPEDKAANRHFLTYLENRVFVLRDRDLISALFPYQRVVGDNFMFAALADGRIVPWVIGAAEAQQRWDEEGRGPTLNLTAEDRAFGEETLRALGLPEGAWYVGLHVREGGFHGEPPGAIGEHRNADIGDYLPAINRVLEAGGYVIRFGDRSMTALPAKPGLIEYGRSEQKSARMDVFLMGSCRFIIGTTSGLTTAAQAFGTPMLLVNCISNDWQFWPANTRFLVKHIYDRRLKRDLIWREIYREPTQGLLVSNIRLRRTGRQVRDNTPEEIDVAVQGMLARHAGSETVERSLDDRYRHAMRDNPLMFGAAMPDPAFIVSHPELLTG